MHDGFLYVKNLEVTNAFTNNCKDYVVNLQTLKFKVDEATVLEATGIAPEGERWFKKHRFEVDLSMFLLPSFEKLYWGKGINLNNVKLEWRDILNIFQCYITFKGRFATMFRYHLSFLLHLNGESKLNLSYRMFKIIKKMVTRVRKHPNHTSHLCFIMA